MNRLFMRIVTIAASLVAVAASSVAAASEAAAVRLVPGALYTSQAAGCRSPGPGLSCVFKFRAGDDGESLAFVGITAVNSWRCNGGGGEALLGGKKGQPIPRALVALSGKLHGSTTFRSSNGKQVVMAITGSVAADGKSAVIVFHTSTPGFSCVTQPVSLTAH